MNRSPRVYLSLALLLAIALLSACKTADSAREGDEDPVERATVSTDTLPDPFAVAQKWAQNPTFDGLPADVEDRASSWKAGQVARLYAVTEGYRAVVHNYTTAQDAPAVLLTIARDASGRWRVVDAKLTRSDHLWTDM